MDSMSVTSGFPSVIVPVLSNTMVLILSPVSSASADLKRMPCSAPLPVPTIMATGVASPRAHGHEIIKTDIPMDNANSAE